MCAFSCLGLFSRHDNSGGGTLIPVGLEIKETESVWNAQKSSDIMTAPCPLDATSKVGAASSGWVLLLAGGPEYI